ncbi:MAG: hypothetical protein ACQESE_04015 [Nanobdellota archaeon]
MKGKGQITIIVIIGLVLLIGVGLYFGFMTASNSDSLDRLTVESIDTEGKSVDQIMEQAVLVCSRPLLHNISRQAVRTRFFTVENGLSSDNIPYFYFAGRSLFPSRAEVAASMEVQVESEMWGCIDSTVSGIDRLSGELTFEDDPIDIDITVGESELIGITSLNGFYVAEDSQKRLKPVRTSVDSIIGTYYTGIEMMLYPPVLDKDDYFFTPAFEYFDEAGISAHAYSVPESDLLFVLEKSIADDTSYTYGMTFKFHGVSS